MEPVPAHRPEDAALVVTVYSTRRGLVLATVAPIALLGLGGAALADGGWQLIPGLLAAIGSGLALIVLLDLPRRAEFRTTGVTRVCWLRRHHLPWGRLVAIERSRPTTLAAVRNATARGDETPAVVSGGLVARGRGRRRWLLSDHVEGRAEHDRLAALLDTLHPPVMMRAARPAADTAPTDLYRRG